MTEMSAAFRNRNIQSAHSAGPLGAEGAHRRGSRSDGSARGIRALRDHLEQIEEREIQIEGRYRRGEEAICLTREILLITKSQSSGAWMINSEIWPTLGVRGTAEEWLSSLLWRRTRMEPRRRNGGRRRGRIALQAETGFRSASSRPTAVCPLTAQVHPAVPRSQSRPDAEGEENTSAQASGPVCDMVEVIDNSLTLILHIQGQLGTANDLGTCGSYSCTSPERTVGTDASGAVVVASCVREELHTHPPPLRTSASAQSSSSASVCPSLQPRSSQLAQGRCVLAPPAQDGLPVGPDLAVLSAQAGPGAVGEEGEAHNAPADSGPVAREQELDGILAEGRLRVLCWNIEHKKHIQEIDELNERHWDVLCLQELHNDFQAGGHIVRRVRSHNGQVSTAVVVHKRLAPLLVRWGGVQAPWAILRLPGSSPPQTIGVASVYLPTHGRRSGADRPDEVWTRVLQGVEHDIREAQSLSSWTVIAGDRNTSNLAGVCKLSTSSEYQRAEANLKQKATSQERQGDESAQLSTARRTYWGVLKRRKARVLLPRGGFIPTFVPWNTAQEPKTLDYVAVSRQNGQEVKTEAILATAHHLLALHVSSPGFPAADSVEHDRFPDPMRYARLFRRRKVRRRWPDWREMHEGQLASLIPDVAWDTTVASLGIERRGKCYRGGCFRPGHGSGGGVSSRS